MHGQDEWKWQKHDERWVWEDSDRYKRIEDNQVIRAAGRKGRSSWRRPLPRIPGRRVINDTVVARGLPKSLASSQQTTCNAVISDARAGAPEVAEGAL